MSDEKSQQQTSTESTVAGAAKTGKAIPNIAKGAAAGGAHGAAIEAGKSSAKWLIPLIAAVLLPLILVAMLPSIIFGSLLGDGTDSPNGISNDEVLVQNMTAINEGISFILSEGLTDVLERIDSDFASSGCDGKEINNPFGADVVFNANAFVSQYCAHKDTEIASISKEDMEALLTANKDKLYSFDFTDEEREIPPEHGDEDSGETIHETIRIYTISYNGEAYFADQVFHLSDDQKLLASQYAQNLTVLLGDGIYQGLSETEFSAMDLSYDGVVFADGETQVVYYNQLDERWKYSPYGTDTIGGYACGPTAMSIWEQEATKPPEELGIRIKQPRKKGKRPTKTEKQLNKNNRKMVPSHKKQVTYSEDFVPVKDIRNGIIEMEDGRYIKVLEVEPINFLLRSTSEQKNIVASFASWMKISPIKIQIKVLTKKADIGKHLSTIERDMESESNPKCRELQLDYYRLIQTIGSREAITRRFLVIFEYEAVTNRKPEYSEIVSALETAVQTARQYFLHCDNAVVTHDDENAFLLEILYTIFNRSTCEVKTVEQRIGELQLARRDTDITVPVSLKSVLAPDSIDLTHGSYVVMDGVYLAYLIVPSDGYNPRVVAGWTSILVNAGEGIDVDFYFSREPKERIQAKLGQQIRINRSRLKDTSDTNSDFDDFESAIRSGYFLKEGLANYEDFYYCNTLVTITADTLENLEWRISEVRRLMVSQDMDIRICRFRQEQALLSILPLCSLNKKLFEASKRNMLKTVYVERGKCAQIEWENSAVTGQIQIRKYSSEDNTVTGQLAGTPLEGAVFEITQARSGKVVGYIVTDARGVAASGPLPLGRYFVTEVSAPKYYQLSGEKMEAEIEYPSQIIKLSAYNKPASLGVTIKKSGNYEVQSGQTMSYDFSGIANTSNVALNHFFWHDRIPTDATRALSISTGTYNARLYYKVTFKTNLNDYRTLASNLQTSNNYSLSLNAATLRLAQGEYVTDVRFEFGTVPSGFSSVVKPTMRVQVLGTVSNGYQIINRADVGGQYLNEWQTAKTTWVTTVRRFNTTPLPKTGY